MKKLPMNKINIISQSEIELLKTTKRYKIVNIDFLGKKLKIVDSASFLSSYKEIFENQILYFRAENDNPTIIDCGANIGLSVLFFKYFYPNAHIIAFEPVPEIFEVLKYNISQFGYNNIVLHRKAIWKETTKVPFMNEGADGGRILIEGDKDNIIKVETVQLRNFIKKPVDFLKIDIEGAETEVIQNISNQLKHVKNIFIEYHSFSHKKQTVDLILHYLIDAGFRIHIHPQNISKCPFIRRNTHLGMDLQLNIFGIRT